MSAKAATILESHFHCAKVLCPSFFCAICQVTFYAGLVFYAVFLLWNILFKYTAPWQLFSSSRYYSRTLNLVPYYDWLAGGYFNSLDLYGNIILFFPMGIYLNYYSNNARLFIGIASGCVMVLVAGLVAVLQLFN